MAYKRRTIYDINDCEFSARIIAPWTFIESKKKKDNTYLPFVEIPCVCNYNPYSSNVKSVFKLVAWGNAAVRFKQMNPIVGDGLHFHAQYCTTEIKNKETGEKTILPHFNLIGKVRIDSLTKREPTEADEPVFVENEDEDE